MTVSPPHLLQVSYPEDAPLSELFPFSLPWLSTFTRTPLILRGQVSVIVGENGSGKSSLLESIALARRLPSVGSYNSEPDPSLARIAPLVEYLRLSWRRKSGTGFFFRAEDYFGFVTRIDRERAEHASRLREIEQDESLSDFARSQAKMTHANSLSAYRSRYGESGLDALSHGESLLAFFESRLVPGGFYIIDEPEAALSPMRCLTFLAMVKQIVAHEKTQLIIATHSPILMAIPDAQLLYMHDGVIEEAEYDELPHVELMRHFLRLPERYLQHL